MPQTCRTSAARANTAFFLDVPHPHPVTKNIDISSVGTYLHFQKQKTVLILSTVLYSAFVVADTSMSSLSQTVTTSKHPLEGRGTDYLF